MEKKRSRTTSVPEKKELRQLKSKLLLNPKNGRSSAQLSRLKRSISTLKSNASWNEKLAEFVIGRLSLIKKKSEYLERPISPSSFYERQTGK